MFVVVIEIRPRLKTFFGLRWSLASPTTKKCCYKPREPAQIHQLGPPKLSRCKLYSFPALDSLTTPAESHGGSCRDSPSPGGRYYVCAMLPAGTNIKEKSATSAISRLPQAGLDLSCSICNAELLTQPPSSR